MPLTLHSSTQGNIGELHTINVNDDDVLIFQLPRSTRMLSDTYVQNAQEALNEVLPEGKQALILGADVNIFSLCGEEALTLRLKGII